MILESTGPNERVSPAARVHVPAIDDDNQSLEAEDDVVLVVSELRLSRIEAAEDEVEDAVGILGLKDVDGTELFSEALSKDAPGYADVAGTKDEELGVAVGGGGMGTAVDELEEGLGKVIDIKAVGVRRWRE